MAVGGQGGGRLGGIAGQGSPSARITSGGSGASVVRVQHMSISVKSYPILESQLSELTLFNSVSTVFLSFGSALITYGAGVYSSAMIQSQLSDTAKGFVAFAVPAPMVVGLLSLIAGGAIGAQRWFNIRNIKTRAVILENA